MERMVSHRKSLIACEMLRTTSSITGISWSWSSKPVRGLYTGLRGLGRVSIMPLQVQKANLASLLIQGFCCCFVWIFGFPFWHLSVSHLILTELAQPLHAEERFKRCRLCVLPDLPYSSSQKQITYSLQPDFREGGDVDRSHITFSRSSS